MSKKTGQENHDTEARRQAIFDKLMNAKDIEEECDILMNVYYANGIEEHDRMSRRLYKQKYKMTDKQINTLFTMAKDRAKQFKKDEDNKMLNFINNAK